MSEQVSSNRAIKAGIWYTISNFVSKGLVFLTTPIFTRILSKSQFGEYNNFATWQSLLIIIVTLELYSTIARAKYDFENEFNQYISSITIAGTLFTGICYIVVLCFMPFFSKIFDLSPNYIHIIFLYLLFAPALQIVLAKNRVMMRYKVATVLALSSSIISTVAALVLCMTCEDRLLGRVIGQEGTLLLVNLSLFGFIIFQGKCFKLNHCKYAFAIAVPLVPHLLAGNLLGSFDKIVINKLCGSEDLAYYGLAFSCALLAKVLWDSLNQAMVPWLYDHIEKNESNKILKVSRVYILGFMYIAFGIMLFVPEVLMIFGGRSYIDAKYVMPPIIMGSCYQFAYSMYVNLEMYKKKTFLISIGTIAAALLNIPLNYIFVRMFGYVAAAYTTMFCYAMLFVFHYLIVKRLQIHHVYDNRFNFILLAVMTVVTILTEFVYSIEHLRRILLIVYCLSFVYLTFKHRDQISTYIRKRRS